MPRFYHVPSRQQFVKDGYGRGRVGVKHAWYTSAYAAGSVRHMSRCSRYNPKTASGRSKMRRPFYQMPISERACSATAARIEWPEVTELSAKRRLCGAASGISDTPLPAPRPCRCQALRAGGGGGVADETQAHAGSTGADDWQKDCPIRRHPALRKRTEGCVDDVRPQITIRVFTSGRGHAAAGGHSWILFRWKKRGSPSE